MNGKALFLSLALAVFATASVSAQNDVVAGIPVNYDESKVGDYKLGLPDPLVMNNGKKVKNARQWMKKRRPEIVKLFETYEYGKWAAPKPKLRYDVIEDQGFGGLANRKQVTVYLSDKPDGPSVDVLIYLPKNVKGPAPLLLNLSFSQNNLAVSDPGVKPGTRWDPATGQRVKVEMPPMPAGAPARPRFGMDETIKTFLEAGYGFATLCYTDIEPDNKDGWKVGVRGLFFKDGQTQPANDEWGTISAWAWGISTVMDYFEKDKDIDAKRIALTGCSRLGKTTIWTAARDPRFAVVIPSCSGEGGAAISRRNYGENVAHITAESRYRYQFCYNYSTYADRVNELPVDANLLVALIAPRPLLLQTGTTDTWSDSKGEWVAAVEAAKVYELFGKDALYPGAKVDEVPAADHPVYSTLGYVIHEGGHGVMPQDWTYYLEFIKKHL
ncbi:MAG: acetylxylan esterase [Bacteroidales bacterium]|nr:acetylxylan esterase [Bacteroidales bacterium]